MGKYSPVAPINPVPRVWDEWEAGDASLYTMVLQEHKALLDEEEYAQLLDATTDRESVSGRRSYDTVLAAQMIVANAKTHGGTLASGEYSLAQIGEMLNTILRVHGQGRNQRREHFLPKSSQIVLSAAEYDEFKKWKDKHSL